MRCKGEIYMAKFTCNFISYTLKRTVDITVVVPTVTIPESMGMGLAEGEKPSHNVAAPFPVLYLLHGMGNNHATWTGYTNVEMYAEERNIVVVNISAENKSYVNHPSGDNFYDFIAGELPEFVKSMFPISDKPEDTYIAGLSMGGFGTLVHALNRPEQFAALGAFSAAVSLNPASLTGGEDRPIEPRFDPATLAKEVAASGKKFPALYIACGEKDFLIDANKAFVKDLEDMGQQVTWVTMPQYGHEWRFWDIQVEEFLDWIPRTDAYAKTGKRQI